jgi:hypothetical protein
LGSIEAQAARSCWLATEQRSFDSRGSSVLFRDWQRTHTQSSAKALASPRQQMDVRSCWKQGPQAAVRHTCATDDPDPCNARSPERALRPRVFS